MKEEMSLDGAAFSMSFMYSSTACSVPSLLCHNAGPEVTVFVGFISICLPSNLGGFDLQKFVFIL